MSSRIALILGAGPRTGRGLAQGFSKAGYAVVTVSRTPRDYDGTAKLAISADFTDSASIPSVFDQVRAKLGEPEVVIYNGPSCSFPPGHNSDLVATAAGLTSYLSDAKDPFSKSTDDFVADLTVNVTSAYVAAQESTKSFRALGAGKRGHFFAVGNMFNNSGPALTLMTVGLGKTALANLMAVGHKAYGPQGHSCVPLL